MQKDTEPTHFLAFHLLTCLLNRFYRAVVCVGVAALRSTMKFQASNHSTQASDIRWDQRLHTDCHTDKQLDRIPDNHWADSRIERPYRSCSGEDYNLVTHIHKGISDECK